MFFVRAIDAFTPLARLTIQIFPTGEGAAGKKVFVNEGEGAFDAGGAVGVATLVSSEAKPEAFSESVHLGNRDHVGSCSAQDHDVRVINHHALH